MIDALTSSVGWCRTPLSPALETGEVAVWRFAAGIRHPIETVASRYLGPAQSSALLRRSAKGRPELQGSALRISLAHSGHTALVAATFGSDVGVDVEAIRTGIEDWSLVSHALTADERAGLQILPSSERSEAFLSIWTRKEALLKAVGVGLSVDPQLVELEGRRIVACPPELGGPRDWTLVDLPLPGHVAALAVKGPLSALLLYDARPGQADDHPGDRARDQVWARSARA